MHCTKHSSELIYWADPNLCTYIRLPIRFIEGFLRDVLQNFILVENSTSYFGDRWWIYCKRKDNFLLRRSNMCEYVLLRIHPFFLCFSGLSLKNIYFDLINIHQLESIFAAFTKVFSCCKLNCQILTTSNHKVKIDQIKSRFFFLYPPRYHQQKIFKENDSWNCSHSWTGKQEKAL